MLKVNNFDLLNPLLASTLELLNHVNSLQGPQSRSIVGMAESVMLINCYNYHPESSSLQHR